MTDNTHLQGFVLSAEEAIASVELRSWGWRGEFLVVLFSRANTCSFIGNSLILFLTCKSTCLPRRFSYFPTILIGLVKNIASTHQLFSWLGCTVSHPQQIAECGSHCWPCALKDRDNMWEILYPCWALESYSYKQNHTEVCACLHMWEEISQIARATLLLPFLNF